MDISDYYKSLPPFTRYYITAVIILAGVTSFNLINPYTLLLFTEQVTTKFEVIKFILTS